MDKTDTPRFRKELLWIIPKNLFLYALVPFLFLRFLAQPIGSAVRLSDAAAFWILLAVFGAVCLNWFVYSVIHQKRPSLLVFAYGMLCLLAVEIIEQESLPNYAPLTSTLAIVCGLLTMVFLLLLSFWFASRRSRPAHSTAVCLWVILGVFFCSMAYRVIRDFESELVSRDTWITIGIMIALIIGFKTPRICSAVRRARKKNRATGLAAGRIVQIIGETFLDRDEDLVTNCLARIQYDVDGVQYETRAGITRYTIRRFGRAAFIGREVPVSYDPANPAGGYAKQIGKKVLDPKDRQGLLSFMTEVFQMNFLRKDPPACCPRCGEKDGWNPLPEEPEYASAYAETANPFSAAPIRGTFGESATRRKGSKSKKLRYLCRKCGYEKTY